jgi:hypothetical protein
MTDLCVPYLVTTESGLTEDQARTIMTELLPTLKRWRVAVK